MPQDISNLLNGRRARLRREYAKAQLRFYVHPAGAERLYFASQEEAQAAATQLREEHPGLLIETGEKSDEPSRILLHGCHARTNGSAHADRPGHHDQSLTPQENTP